MIISIKNSNVRATKITSNKITVNITGSDQNIKNTSYSELRSHLNPNIVLKNLTKDYITSSILFDLTNKALARLTSMINACLSMGNFPSSWKNIEVIRSMVIVTLKHANCKQ